MAERQRLLDDWKDWYASKQAWLKKMAEGRAEILGEAAAEQAYVLTDTEIEELVGVEETVLKSSSGL